MDIEEAKNKKAKAEMEIAHILEKLEAETVIEPDCYYDQALNEKNFRKKLNRIGLLSV